MNKNELISLAANKANMSKKTIEEVLTAILESIEESLAKGDKIQLVGFGTFEAKLRKAREGRNPKTGETIQIPATRVPVFKPGKSLKDTISANLHA
ncbi:DNA-binding protein HU-beta [Desulforamulus putei DSM 12395]|uniref:DNA-binding protein HU-beta n=1 Tax=Desulforamulus putei DSM 12395 TaxID=1121429 RepID=A0A1M5DDG8_9FIRM|nr:HU family DNA-binding protein [Desulforamulus putei]SHF65128.1 DNA-binding protein HU-beta [Desulforamulus putei DSM 12395]